jgi:ketosteroid isomerase-like protein
MSAEHVEIVRAMYDAWEGGDFRAGATDLDEHVVSIVQPSFPEAGIYHGPGEVSDYMRRFLSMWERYSIKLEDLRAVGDTVIAASASAGSER